MKKRRNFMREFRKITDPKERRNEIKALFRRHEENIIRRDMIKFHQMGDEDRDIGGMDYSAIRVQSSNMSDISDQIIRREEELKNLEYEIELVNRLMSCIRGRQKERDLIIVQEYLIECKLQAVVMDKLFLYNKQSFSDIVNRIVDKMVKVLLMD